MLESLGSARLSSNSGPNGDLLGKDLSLWCQHRKAKSDSREWTSSSLAVPFTLILFLAGSVCLAQNFVFILASMTYFLGILKRLF